MPPWKPLAGLTLLALVGIVAFQPDYVELQTAESATAFAELLGDEDARTLAAVLCDMLFSIGYGLLGVIVFRALARRALVGLGVVLSVSAAGADIVENVFVMLNVVPGPSDARIEAMLAAGTVKWLLLTAAGALLMVVALRRRFSGDRTPRPR